MEQNFKRNIAHKMKVGAILGAKPFIEGERLRFLELEDKQIVRVNLIANITDKYVQDGEKKFASITLDDATGQIKAKTFGDEIEKFSNLNQGDTVLIIGLVRSWNNEIYITPEIIKKKEPAYLIVRKLEIEAEQPKKMARNELNAVKDNILNEIRLAEKEGGIDIEKIILQLKEPPEIINQEIKKLLEEGLAYEPRPGKLRYLG